MKNKFTKLLFAFVASFAFSSVVAQNVSLNMLVLNSGFVPINGNGTLKATVNATTGSSGQTNPVPAGKVNVSVTVPPSLRIAATQNNIPAGWAVRNNDGTVINICNSTNTIAVNTGVDLLIDLEGVTATTGAPTMSGQITFKTNCTAPGSLSGDNPSDNSGQAGFSVTGTTPVTITNFSAALINCHAVLKWITESEINNDRFEIEKNNKIPDEWIVAGTVEATGNSSVKKEYFFQDKESNVTGREIIYRLKIFDKNGGYKYSEILPVFITCKTDDVHVYPNPVQSGILKIGITGIRENITATLLSVTGQFILKSNLISGTNTINVSGIANGEYILKVDFEKGNIKKIKVIVQK